ncbi:ankyrin repeat domain-containing protein, partial [Pseudomonas aeruginosa]
MTDSPRPELDMETQEFVHQLFDLARQGNSQRLEQLLQQGLPPNLRNHKGDSLLMLASYHGHADTVRLLLAYKADPDLRNLAGQTPLAGAAFKGDLAMVELLLAGGGPTPTFTIAFCHGQQRHSTPSYKLTSMG